MIFTWEQIENAFINNDITLEQLLEILIDNFGHKKALKILQQNINAALEQEKNERIK